MPTYLVRNKLAPPGAKPRIVQAPLPGTARAHVAADTLEVEKIEVSAAMRLAKEGVELEVAGEEKKPQQEFPLPDKDKAGE